jgi:hypothetical protein
LAKRREVAFGVALPDIDGQIGDAAGVFGVQYQWPRA